MFKLFHFPRRSDKEVLIRLAAELLQQNPNAMERCKDFTHWNARSGAMLDGYRVGDESATMLDLDQEIALKQEILDQIDRWKEHGWSRLY